MSRSMKLLAVGAVFATLAAVPAIAQPPGQGFGRGPGGPVGPGQAANEAPLLVIYARPNYQGQTNGFTTSQDRTPAGTVAWGSITVRGAWQLCSGPSYTGNCITVDRDAPNLQGFPRGVGSFRIVQGGGRGGPGGPQLPPAERGDNASLRGNTAVFYPRPAERGFRIEVQNGDTSRGRYGSSEPRNQDVLAEANRFCRTTGFARVSNAGSEQVNRRWYLSDVLCVRG